MGAKPETPKHSPTIISNVSFFILRIGQTLTGQIPFSSPFNCCRRGGFDSFASSFQFFTRLAAVFAQEVKEAIKTLLKVFLLLFVFSAILMYGCGIDRETLEQFPDP